MSGEIAVSLIALFGVVLAAIAQWFGTRWSVRAESDRLHRQLQTEFGHQQFSEWQSKFRDVVADLLAATDPELSARPNKAKVVPLVLKVQLMLDPKVAAHARVNALVNQLALAVNGWESHDTSSVLRLHGALLEAARDAMLIPARYGA